MTPEIIALAFAATMAAGVVVLLTLVFAPEIAALLSSPTLRKGKARKGDRKKETNP